MNIPLFKKILIYICLIYTPLSCAADQNNSNIINKEKKTMQDKNDSCASDNQIIVSQKLLNFIIDDVVATYDSIGGGGISSIKQKATNIYEVSLPQEGRVDVLTYELKVDESCVVSLVNKSESTINMDIQ